MAITAIEYLVFSTLRRNNAFPPTPRILELGESNWYGDVPLDNLLADIDRYVTDAALKQSLSDELRSLSGRPPDQVIYPIARIFFRAFTQFASYSAVDPGTPSAEFRFDLNQPVDLRQQFDVTLNFGTGEHIFNVHQFYKTAHDLTASGGLMIHTAPFTGWPDHGFYNFQPTFFFDLAHANGYQPMLAVCAQLNPFRYVQINSRDDVAELFRQKQIPPSSSLTVVLRKTSPAEFVAPIQGYYAGTLSPEGMRAWHELR